MVPSGVLVVRTMTMALVDDDDDEDGDEDDDDDDADDDVENDDDDDNPAVVDGCRQDIAGRAKHVWLRSSGCRGCFKGCFSLLWARRCHFAAAFDRRLCVNTAEHGHSSWTRRIPNDMLHNSTEHCRYGVMRAGCPNRHPCNARMYHATWIQYTSRLCESVVPVLGPPVSTGECRTTCAALRITCKVRANFANPQQQAHLVSRGKYDDREYEQECFAVLLSVCVRRPMCTEPGCGRK